MRKNFLPFALPELDQTDFDEVRDTLESGWITMGPKVRRFERRFAEFVGAPHAVAVNSCTAALHLALESVGLRRGDMVLTTPYSFAATAEVIRYFQAVPVFVDVERDTLNMDPVRLAQTLIEIDSIRAGREPSLSGLRKATRNLEESIRSGRSELKAILPVHIAGQPCDMLTISSIAGDNDVPVVEDAAHALPAATGERTVGGSFELNEKRIVCFSFYATKTLTTGEGGMITTGRKDWAQRCRVMRLHGINADAWKRYASEGSWYYEITAPGFKYNMTDVAAAMGLAQLSKSERMWRRRVEIAEAYNEALQELPEVEIPTLRPGIRHAWHLYMLRLHLKRLRINRAGFVRRLKELKIGASVHFIPLHLHPYYRDSFGYGAEDFPIACDEYEREVSLPIYSRMTDQDVRDVIEAVSAVVEEGRRVSVPGYATAGS